MAPVTMVGMDRAAGVVDSTLGVVGVGLTGLPGIRAVVSPGLGDDGGKAADRSFVFERGCGAVGDPSPAKGIGQEEATSEVAHESDALLFSAVLTPPPAVSAGNRNQTTPEQVGAVGIFCAWCFPGVASAAGHSICPRHKAELEAERAAMDWRHR